MTHEQFLDVLDWATEQLEVGKGKHKYVYIEDLRTLVSERLRWLQVSEIKPRLMRDFGSYNPVKGLFEVGRPDEIEGEGELG
jgi:hypothetical protein